MLIATFQLQIDPTNATGPISIPLKEMPTEDANARGARTLLTVCLLPILSGPPLLEPHFPDFHPCVSEYQMHLVYNHPCIRRGIYDTQ